MEIVSSLHQIVGSVQNGKCHVVCGLNVVRDRLRRMMNLTLFCFLEIVMVGDMERNLVDVLLCT